MPLNFSQVLTSRLHVHRNQPQWSQVGHSHTLRPSRQLDIRPHCQTSTPQQRKWQMPCSPTGGGRFQRGHKGTAGAVWSQQHWSGVDLHSVQEDGAQIHGTDINEKPLMQSCSRLSDEHHLWDLFFWSNSSNWKTWFNDFFLHLVLIKSKMFLTKYLKRCDLHCCWVSTFCMKFNKTSLLVWSANLWFFRSYILSKLCYI